MPQSQTDTSFEKFLRNVVDHVITALPNIIKNGYQGGGMNVPPRDSVVMPDAITFTLDDTVVLCPLFYNPVGKTTMDLTGTTVSGLSTISRYADITFPVQDTTMVLPLVFSALPVTGKWSTTTQCQEQPESGEPPPPEASVHSGSFTAHLNAVQLTLTLELDPNAIAVKSASLKLTDDNKMWTQQPTVNDADVVFDPGTSRGQQGVLRGVLKTDTFKSQVRTRAQTALESQPLADEIKDVLNQMLAS